jgi:membrane fusion protein (multidrug efflux system)
MPLLHVSRQSSFSPRLATVAAVVLLVLAGCGKSDAPAGPGGGAGGARPAPEVGVVVATRPTSAW